MPNIFSFSNLRDNEEEKGAENGDDDNRFYVGGASARGGGSGLSVIGGDGNSGSSDDAMKRIIEQARAQTQDGVSSNVQGARVITFYRNGFTVDDGPFRDINDPSNKEFFDSISKGVVPRELEGESRTEPVNINLVDKRGEDYVAPPKPKYTAYSGEGQKMGGSNVDEAAVVAAVETDGKPVVDESQPTTTLQIRLHNGKRLREKLNLSHTVQDITRIIADSGEGNVPYVLLAGFPPQQLTDMNKTIEAAGLKGASITQKLAQ